jgi:O-succinylbenzoate synthase
MAFEWIEEPVAEATPEERAQLATLGVPIALDESLTDPAQVSRALDDPAVSALVLKPTVLGGLRRSRTLALEALARNKGVAIGSSFESGVGLAHLVHLASSLGRPDLVHGLGTMAWFPDHVGGPRPVEGFLGVPSTPEEAVGDVVEPRMP